MKRAHARVAERKEAKKVFGSSASGSKQLSDKYRAPQGGATGFVVRVNLLLGAETAPRQPDPSAPSPVIHTLPCLVRLRV